MKKIIVFLVCFVSACLFLPIYAQNGSTLMGTNEVTETYKVQPGFCVGMEDFSSNVAPYLSLWTYNFFDGDPRVFDYNVDLRNGALIVTVALDERYLYEYNIEDYMLEFCQFIRYNVDAMGGSVTLTSVSFDR